MTNFNNKYDGYKYGYLYYDDYTRRYVLYPNDGGDEIPLHCGDCFQFYSSKDSKWRATRIEYDHSLFNHAGDWYLVGTNMCGSSLQHLKVRF